MKDELTKEQSDAILKALDEALTQGPWEATAFLKMIGKQLRETREGFLNHTQAAGQGGGKMAAHLANRIALRSGQQEIFISLYSADGMNMTSWERIVMNLPKQMISRPVYASEEDVKTLIKTKINKINEAYVSLYISQSDILAMPSDKTLVDKLGVPLLSLKDRSLRLENINCFVHQSGVYQYVFGRLIKNASLDDT